MSSARWLSPLGCIAFAGTAALLAVTLANAQTDSLSSGSHAATASASESSSTDYLALVDSPDAAEPAAPAPAAGQYDNSGGGGGGKMSGLRNHLAFELAGGFNGPTSYTSNYLTWGGQFSVGGGLRLKHGLSMLIDYQFMDDKLPGKLIGETGATGGKAHIWSVTLNPVWDLFPKRTNSVYVTGGGGFYRKLTEFTNLEPTQYCSYFYCGTGYAPQTVGHFSSNQGGFSIGGGFSHKFGGMYGEGHTAIFAEARYLDVLTPVVDQSPNGLGVAVVGAGTKVMPFNFGVRF